METLVRDATDAAMMQRCIALSRTAAQDGEFPFACVIAKDGAVVVETTNRVARDGDVTRHAELVAVSLAQKALGTKDLSGCTLYSNVEPCAMCAFPIRETRIKRVVYAIGSPMMGGLSKWNVLGDDEIANAMPVVFGERPEVAAGLHYRQAAAVWQKWNPAIWLGIRLRGCLADPASDNATMTLQSRPPAWRSLPAVLWRGLVSVLARILTRKRTAPTG